MMPLNVQIFKRNQIINEVYLNVIGRIKLCLAFYHLRTNKCQIPIIQPYFLVTDWSNTNEIKGPM